MNALDLVKAFGFIDDDLVFDAANDGAAPESSPVASGAKQPKPGKPPRGGARTKGIIIGVVAVVLAAIIAVTVMYFTGVFTAEKQVPVYTGMTISSTNDSAASASSVSYKYSGDYYGRNDDIDKDKPFGDSSVTIEQAAQSSLQIVSAGDTIYYADAGDDIYVAINFDNPDKYDIVSFVINDGTTDYYYGGLYGNFEDGSNYDQIIIKLNVGTTGGIIEYSISKIKYLDDNSVNSDVVIGGETVVKCGVRTSEMTSATVTAETTTLTSISFTANVTDKYSLIDYSNGYVKAVLYDGDSIIQTVDLEVGTNEVEFTNLSPYTLYQYAVVAYYDDLSGSGAALHYLYTNAIYTPAVVLFDEIEVGQESISFNYSWYTGYSSNLTSLTLTHNGETKALDVTATSIKDLLSDNEYTLTASYVGINGKTATITLEFTTEAKAIPEVKIEVKESTESSVTFTVDITDESNICNVTSIAVYKDEAVSQSYATNLTEISYSGIVSGAQYTLKFTYEYNLNDGSDTVQVVKSISFNSAFAIGLDDFAVINTSAVYLGDYIMFSADIYNPSKATIKQAVINNVIYDVSSISNYTKLYVSVPTSGFETGKTTFTLSQIICSYDNSDYTINVYENNDVDVYIYNDELAEVTIESVKMYYYYKGSYVEIGDNLGIYTGDYNELRLEINLYNPANHVVTSAYIGTYINNSSSGMEYEVTSMSSDYQTVYISHIGFGTNIGSDQVYGEGVVNVIVGSLTYTNGTKTATTTVDYDAGTFCSLGSAEIVEIYTAEDLLAITFMEETEALQIYTYRYYKLMNDIDLAGYNWTNSNTLWGVFDGNGYTIKNLTYTTECKSGESIYSGLFYSICGIVTNLNMTGIDYKISNVTDTSYIHIGAIAGSAEVVRVYNCSFSGSITLMNSSTGYVSTYLDLIGEEQNNIVPYKLVSFNTYVICNGDEKYFDENGQLSE